MQADRAALPSPTRLLRLPQGLAPCPAERNAEGIHHEQFPLPPSARSDVAVHQALWWTVLQMKGAYFKEEDPTPCPAVCLVQVNKEVDGEMKDVICGNLVKSLQAGVCE